MALIHRSSSGVFVSIIYNVFLFVWLMRQFPAVRADNEVVSKSSLPRNRYEIKSDAFPAPKPGEQAGFANRLLHWHQIYCGKNRVCRNHVASGCYRCAPCQCDLNCSHFGDCCPDVVVETSTDNFLKPFTGSYLSVTTCENTELQDPPFEFSDSEKDIRTKRQADSPTAYRLEKDTRTRRQADVLTAYRLEKETQSQSYFMVSGCPQTYSGDAHECQDSGTIAPVSSSTNDSAQVFINIHCALCHGVDDAVPWNIQISCENKKNFSSLYTPRDVLLMSLSQPDCMLAYIPPSLHAARKCYSEPAMISRCNVTGSWRKRDSFLERACHSFLTPKVVDKIMYKNVFCFMCNHDDEPETHMLLTSCQKPPMSWSPPLEVSLRHQDLQETDSVDRSFGDIRYKTCNSRGVYDHIEESCRDVVCELGQQMVAAKCQPMFATVRGMAFELYFGLRASEPIDISGDHGLLHRLPTEMEVYLGQTLLQGQVKLQDFAMSFNTTGPDGRCGQTSSDLGVYARLISESPVDQTNLQNELLQVRHAKFSIVVQAWNLSFQAFPSETVWHTLQPLRRQAPQTLSSCVIMVSNSHMGLRRDGTMRVGTTTPDPVTSAETQTTSLIRVSSLLECPQVQLLQHEYSPTDPQGALKLQWEVVLPSNRYLSNHEGNITICLSDFLLKLEQNRRRKSTVEENLAIVLLTISILCLFSCFAVFLIFPVLRSLTGRNNMVLVVCTCLSQISLLVGYFIDDASRMCALAGVAIHYFTLCAFCSLIVCTYHVYNIFTTMHLSRDRRKERRWVIYYNSFVFLIPVVVVCTVIAAYASRKTTWRTFGYGGGSFCLLSSAISLWVGLFLPVIASTVLVVVLFCLTSNSLHNSKDVETNRSDEKHVHFYLKASLLFSLTWIIGVTGIFTSLGPLMITFVIFQCLMGVYVFVSLVLTPRVTRLLSGSCCQSRRPPRGRTSLHMKMASSNDCPTKPACIEGTGYRKRDPNTVGADSKRHPTERYIRKVEFMDSAA